MKELIILVTGANGQLGNEFVRQLQSTNTVVGLGKVELDVTNIEEVNDVVLNIQPDVIIHTAAYTAVDECEKNPLRAFEVNTLGSYYVAKAAKQNNAKMINFSSDYIFDGKKDTPYLEVDSPNPQSIYGISKYLGEELTKLCENHLIIRTSWLYGHGGKNFVNTMLGLVEKEKIKVVDDQVGTPTYVNDLVRITLKIMHEQRGTYHISNSGTCSWYEFAKAIFEEAGYDPNMITRTTTEQFGALATRPSFSVLHSSNLQKIGLSPLRNWRNALKDYINKERWFYDRRSKS